MNGTPASAEKHGAIGKFAASDNEKMNESPKQAVPKGNSSNASGSLDAYIGERKTRWRMPG
jgi:hypothetical protein